MKKFKKVYIEITNVCNLSCSFCLPHNRKNRFMSFDEFKLILNKIKPYTNVNKLHNLFIICLSVKLCENKSQNTS